MEGQLMGTCEDTRVGDLSLGQCGFRLDQVFFRSPLYANREDLMLGRPFGYNCTREHTLTIESEDPRVAELVGEAGLTVWVGEELKHMACTEVEVLREGLCMVRLQSTERWMEEVSNAQA